MINNIFNIRNIKHTKGITLIALVITIIILLILVGISIAALTNKNGILKNAEYAKEKSIEAQYEEELDITITEMITDVVYSNDEFNMKYIIENLPRYLDKKKVDYEWDKNKVVEEPEGKYKGYIFYIDKDYKAHIDGKVGGIRPQITAEVQTQGYVIEGNTVEIQVIASISSGTVKIIAPDNMNPTNIINETENEKIYTYNVYKNKEYTFIAEGDSGRKTETIIKVNSIIDKPQINIIDNKGTEVTVNVTNNYPEDANITYRYYLGSTIKENVPNKNCIIDGLTENTKYTTKVMVLFDGKTIMSDELEFTTIIIINPPITYMTSLEENLTKTPTEYPILKIDGVMNCIVDCKIGDKIRIELDHVDSGVTNYYSIDGGENWREYTDIIEMEYPGDGLLKAKAVNDVTTSEIKDIIPFSYDETINCTGTKSVGKEAYDRDYKTNYNYMGSQSVCFQVDHECWERFVTMYIHCNSHAIGSYWYGTLSFSNWRKKQIGKSGYIDKLIGSSVMQNLSAKSLKMPKNTHYINIGVGTTGVGVAIYEVWCSENNLTGKVY